MGESTKNLLGPRIIGIVTASNLRDNGIWEGLRASDLAEFRADGFPPAEIPGLLREFRNECTRRLGHALETILTLRLERDGGAWRDVQAAERERVWLSMGLDGEDPACDWIDLETEEFTRLSGAMHALLGASRVKVLLSHHNCRASHSPAALRKLLEEMRLHRPAGMKVALTCRSREEVSQALAFARDLAGATTQACLLSMGSLGRASRVLAPLLGCPLTYGFLTGGPVAPGQMSVFQLRDFFRQVAGEEILSMSNPERIDWAEARLPKESLAA